MLAVARFRNKLYFVGNDGELYHESSNGQIKRSRSANKDLYRTLIKRCIANFKFAIGSNNKTIKNLRVKMDLANSSLYDYMSRLTEVNKEVNNLKKKLYKGRKNK